MQPERARLARVRVEAVGAVLFDERGRLLLIQRGHEPAKGKWSLPGGRIEAGESAEEATIREAHEETGLDVRIVRVAGEVEWPASGASTDTLHITDFVAERIDPSQEAQAGDDAADVRWVTRSELAAFDTTDGLEACLADWGVLPSST
jgi:8-oxo-dGTP diphosphatase